MAIKSIIQLIIDGTLSNIILMIIGWNNGRMIGTMIRGALKK